jgi:hypothetical protein
MNFLAKSILNNQVVSDMPQRRGIPAPFFLTACQQMGSVFIFLLVVGLSAANLVSFKVKRLATTSEYLLIIFLGLFFALNISFNNLSITLLPISVNLVIRTCIPLFTLGAQRILGLFITVPSAGIAPRELYCMLMGVGAAGLAVVASSKGKTSSAEGENFETFLLGCTFCVLALCAAGLNSTLAQVLGSSMKMTPIDTAGYMGVPVFTFCVLPFLFMTHPVNGWYTEEGFEDKNSYTDLMLIKQVVEEAPFTMIPIMLFGPIAFMYNILQIWLYMSLSATHTAFAGNFNKAATIMLSMFLGMEKGPWEFPVYDEDGNFAGWHWVRFFAILGNILAFTAYSLLREQAKRASQAPQPTVREASPCISPGSPREPRGHETELSGKNSLCGEETERPGTNSSESTNTSVPVFKG